MALQHPQHLQRIPYQLLQRIGCLEDGHRQPDGGTPGLATIFGYREPMLVLPQTQGKLVREHYGHCHHHVHDQKW